MTDIITRLEEAEYLQEALEFQAQRADAQGKITTASVCREAAAYIAMLAASPQGEGSSADADTHRAAEGAVVEALRPVTAWLYSWGQHVGSCRGGSFCTCGLTAMREQGSVALDAIDRLPDTPQPDALPGDLRERVARLINPSAFLFSRDELDAKVRHHPHDAAYALADAILSLIQSERGGG